VFTKEGIWGERRGEETRGGGGGNIIFLFGKVRLGGEERRRGVGEEGILFFLLGFC